MGMKTVTEVHSHIQAELRHHAAVRRKAGQGRGSSLRQILVGVRPFPGKSAVCSSVQVKRTNPGASVRQSC